MTLNNRKYTILSLIAKEYLKSGEPVGSKALTLALGGCVSSATVRNDMAQLEREGFLFQPHTSAGRIPTALGLRLYVDRLMEKRALSKKRRDFIDSLFSSVHSVEGAISLASDALASYSQCASFSTSPSGSEIYLKQIDFIKTDPRTLVFVVLTGTNIVKSVFLRLDSEYGDEALNALANLCREKLTRVSLNEITPAFIQNMALSIPEYALLFSPFFDALSKLAKELAGPNIFVKGQDNLLKSHLNGADAVSALDALSSGNILSSLNPNGKINLLIPETNLGLANTALIYSGYKFSDNLSGTIGVLGPFRLDYSSIIPMIEYFSTSLENMLKQSELDK